MAVVPPRNNLEKDKGGSLKFGTNPRNSVRKSHVGFLTLITSLVFLLWFMVLCTGVNYLDVFHHAERICIKTSPDFRVYAVSPFLLPLSFCVISTLESPVLTLSWGLRLFMVLSLLAFLRLVKCLVWDQSSTDLVDIFYQSLHFKVRKQRFLKEISLSLKLFSVRF